jgi:branched-chain amino acid aminotransferase
MLELQNSQVYLRDRIAPFAESNFSIASAPMLYGLSIYTVFPVCWNAKQNKLYAFRLADHFERLQNSARIMDFHDFLENWTYDKFADAMSELLTKNAVQKDALVRVTVLVDEIMTGTRMHGLKHSLVAFVYPFTPSLPTKGAKLCVSSWRRTPDNAIPSRAKINGSYANSSLMKNEALQNGFDDAISLDEHGHVAESTVANIFIVRGGEVITPSGSTDLLEGITRDTVCRLAAKLNITCTSRSIDRSELYLADEIFLSGSSVRIAPVLSVDHRPVGTGRSGSITAKLMQIYDEATHGATPDFIQWRQSVD